MYIISNLNNVSNKYPCFFYSSCQERVRQNQSSNLQNQVRPSARSLPSYPSESYGIRGLVNHNFEPPYNSEPPCQDSEFPTIEVLSQTGQELEVLSYLGKYLKQI